MMRNYYLEAKRQSVIREINAAKMAWVGFRPGDTFDRYVAMLRTLKAIKNQQKGGEVESEKCEACGGTKKIKDSTGLFPSQCKACSMTEVQKPLSPPPDFW